MRDERATGKLTLMDKITMINSTITKGFPWLIFPSPLEHEFQGFVRQRILHRVLPVGISAAVFIIIFCILDWFMLHPHVALHASFVRLIVVLPVIVISTLWLYFKPPKHYLWIYGATLIISGLSVIYIIWLSHIQGINLPYEGLMIILMYGFFIMALPFYMALFINFFIVCIYALTEPFYYLSLSDYLNNILFLSVVLIAAAIGAYVTEHNQRENFLRKRILDLNHEKTLHSIKNKNKYLASASHDIRQPLQGMTLIAQNLKHRQPNDIHIDHLNSSISTLNAMFTQMLDISKINLNLIQPQLTSFSLASLIEQNSQVFSERFKQAGISLETQIINRNITSDFTLLSRIIHNLFENNIQHSQCTTISISSKVTDNNIVLAIMDNGRGIPSSMQQTLFDEFIKGEDSKNGLGLGLAITAQFCQKLDHSLTFNSQPGHTEFSITLPINYSLDTSHTPAQTTTEKYVLLIDDDTNILQGLKQSLTSWGYNVVCASGLHHGMSIINQHEWLCVISDWDLSDGCGEQVVEYCHHHDINNILISSQNHDDTLEFCKHKGSQFLQKPLALSRLRSALLKFK